MSENCELSLGKVQGINQAETLHSKLLAAREQLSSGGSIKIDVSEVVSLDTTTLQLLVSLAQSGVQLVWKSPSARFLAAAEQLGLLEVLGLTIATSDGGDASIS